MKFFVFTFLLFSYLSHAGQDLCQTQSPPKTLYKQADPNIHVLFVRCHPDLPLAFSNRIKEGQSELNGMNPSMINLRTGKITDLPTPKGFSAEDMVPSPDGKYLYVDLSPKGKGAQTLGIFELAGDQIKLKHLIPTEVGEYYGYPSPAIRNGEQLILGRRLLPREDRASAYLDKVTTDGKLIQGPELCPELKLQVLNSISDRPYISPDGEYFGSAIQNVTHIMKIRWDKISPDGKSVPCEIVRKLPESASKVSFSPDNQKIVFHANEQEFLGQRAKSEYQPRSYVMDLKSGETQQISSSDKNYWSEYPYFCGNQGIIVRDVNQSDDKRDSQFKMIATPNLKTKVFVNGCEVGNSSTLEKKIKFWEDVCHEIKPSSRPVTFKIQVNKKNCEDLIRVWRKNASKSLIKESDIQAACRD